MSNLIFSAFNEVVDFYIILSEHYYTQCFQLINISNRLVIYQT